MDKESDDRGVEAKDSAPDSPRADAKDTGGDDGPGSPAKPEAGETPPTGKLLGYTQTYFIWKDKEAPSLDRDGDGKDATEDQCEHEVLFRCGNWCYTGHVVLNRDISLTDMPLVIPLLQRQQSRLHYYCNADMVPAQSNFSKPMRLVYDAADYASAALSSDPVQSELAKWAEVHDWMEDAASTFFEMGLNTDGLPSMMDDVALVCSKTYSRGLVFVTIFFEGSFYFTVADGEGDQPLLDVKFPDVSHHGQGIQLASAPAGSAEGAFDGREPPPWYRGLSLWHALPSEVKIAPPPTRNLSTGSYVQMYMVLRPRAENGGFAVTSAYREVLFRFGSWCYGGSVQLTPVIALGDIPHVIPALRMQQSRLEFVYGADAVPATSPYAKPMAYMMKHTPLMEREIGSAEDVLSKLVERLTAMGMGDSISSWLEGESSQSFFEFAISASDEEAKVLGPVELVATKTYFASGIVLVVIYFSGIFYVVVTDAGAEQPLLDSKFPDVSSKGRGYQVNSYGDGAEGWPGLRKVSVWQTTGAMQAEMDARQATASAGKPVLATAEAVDQLEREQGAKSAVGGSGGGGGEEHAAGAKASSGSEPTGPEEVAEAKASPAAAAEAKAPAMAESKDGPRSPLMASHGAGLGDAARAEGQSLGAFHRLKPMSGMAGQLEKIRGTMGAGAAAAPWDASGRPLATGKGLGSPFGKASLDFKKSPL